MTEKGTFQTINPDHPISRIANTLAGEALNLAATARISKMDVCNALANAIGFILADAAKPVSGGKPLPRDAALSRMDQLRTVMESAYELREVEGGGSK